MEADAGLSIVTVIIMLVVMVAIYLFPLWKIFGKTGMNPYLALVFLVPGIGPLICVLILAFADWPNVDEHY